MLILTRKPGEQIVIGSDIRITVLAVEGNRIRLGVQAPPDVSILRMELGLPHLWRGEARSSATGDVAPYSPEG